MEILNWHPSIFLPFLLKVKLFHQFIQILLHFLLELLISLCLTKHSVEKFVTDVFSGLKLIEKSSHKGIHKVSILQNMLIPRLGWPLLIYKIPISVVNHLEHKIIFYLRNWRNIHCSTNIYVSILQLSLTLCLWKVKHQYWNQPKSVGISY